MIKIEPFKQSEGYCGPTSLKMVLAHYGINASEDELARLANASREDGCDPEDLVRAAKSFNLNAIYTQNNTIETLEEEVKKNTPVIVGWFSDEPHYSVIVGFNNGHVVYADPEFGEIKNMSKIEFISKWFDFYAYPPKNGADLIIRSMIVITPNGYGDNKDVSLRQTSQ